MIYSWLAVFILFSSGIVIAYYGLWVGMLLLFGLMGSVYLIVPRLGREVLISIIILSLGFCYFQYRGLNEQVDLDDAGERALTGNVISYPIYNGERTGFIMKTGEKNKYIRYVQVYCDFRTDLNRGDQVTLQGELEIPDKPGNPGEFDYHNYLLKKRIFYILTLTGEEDIQELTPCGGIRKLLNSYRNKTEEVICDTLPEQEAVILLGMLLGEKENIDESQYEMFQKTGIVHIFAVSGLHIGFLVLFFSYAASILGLFRKYRFIMVIVLLLIYGSLVGWPISVQRAVIMAALALLAHYQGREGGLTNSLGLAGMIIVILEPYAIFTVSFQLSFMATWGLVGLYPLIKDYLSYQNRLLDIILIPLCAQIALIPLLAYYFNLFSPAALISNILISYLVGAVVITGFAALLLVYISVLAAVFLYPAGFMIEWLNWLAAFISNIPGSYLWVKTPALVLMLSYYFVLFMLGAVLYYSWQRRYIWGSVVLLVVSIAVICLPGGLYNRGVLEVVFLDVGQGDSILIKTPGGKFILMDGGGSYYYSVGEKIVVPYLHHRGVRELYMLINSHPDTDHLQGLVETASEIPFDYVVVPKNLFDVEEYENLESIAREKGVPVLTAAAGQHINIEEGLELEVLYPPVGLYSAEYNDQSLVIKCEFGEFSLLLTGDLEEKGLEDMISAVNPGQSLIVKVPHHGSRDSFCEEFYDEINPYAAVISVGENNVYGHPAQEVLDYLGTKGVQVYRTDQNGAVSIESDGKSVVIDCFI